MRERESLEVLLCQDFKGEGTKPVVHLKIECKVLLDRKMVHWSNFTTCPSDEYAELSCT